jgi:two-component system sensor histidine kinase RegB
MKGMSAPAVSLEPAEPRPARVEAWPTQHAEANRIKLAWVLRLHWFAIVGQSVAIVTARWIADIDLPVGFLFGVVCAELAGNLFFLAWSRQAVQVHDHVVAAAMLFDAIILTILLALSGGYTNPFSTLYLVNIALAAVLLDAAWAWAMLGSSLALFGLLFALDHMGALKVLSTLDQEEIAALRVQGMWAAFVIAAGFIVYIVQRVRVALDSVQEALLAERSLSARKDKVASLATLAAGAAHELSTPLSTIAVVVKELQRSAEKNHAPQTALDDLALIREQVARCRDILHHMSARAGENAGEPFHVIPLRQWVDAALAHLPDHQRVEVLAETDLDAAAVEGPPRALSRALRSLLKNALQASPSGAPVRLRVSVSGVRVEMQVIDEGKGMPAEILSRAGEPFFTTKVPGEGMGLGLFLTQALAEQLGGGLELHSVQGQGTTATLELPVAQMRRSEVT